VCTEDARHVHRLLKARPAVSGHGTDCLAAVRNPESPPVG
jgi:hypothetical protein